MRSKSISVSSEFSASVDTIWEKLQSLGTLQYIASPYVKFTPMANTELVWRKGGLFEFDFKLFGFIPMGIHTIKIIQFDKTVLTIYSNESNRYVPVWNHKICLSRIGNNLTHYTDEVEIAAGWKTPFVCLWSKAFYRHRQKKWARLFNGQARKHDSTH